MEQYKVVTEGSTAVAETSKPQPESQSSEPSIGSGAVTAQAENLFSIPDAQSGRVLHPDGRAPLKATAEGTSANLLNLDNGTPITIVGNDDRWYQVKAGSLYGYMHHTWVHVDQFEGGPFGRRHIQIKSFDNFADAEVYVRASSLPLAIYLATNGWFAICLEDTFDQSLAVQLMRRLMEDCDVIVLAQASMAHLAIPLQKGAGTRVLSSPDLCVRSLASYI